MEIHRPKPWQGLREFAREILTIVIGVLLALGAEQVVEALRHRDVVARGEEALKDNFARFVSFNASVGQEQACMAQRTAELRAVLDKAAITHRLPRIGAIPQPEPRPWQIDTWEAMVSSQAATYVPQDRGVLYSRIAVSAVDIYTVALQEWTDWGVLKSLSGPPRPFSDAEEAKARDTLARAASEGELVTFLAANTVVRIERTRLLDSAELKAVSDKGRTSPDAFLMCHPIDVSER
jgi:hypothetical protein